jgi:DGQHR domain-containing protein
MEAIEMGNIRIKVKRDVCLGYEVFRGSAKAKKLAPAMWIDFYDQELNPYGYQRPFNAKRSQQAAKYATEHKKAFWPESILAIRDDPDVDESDMVKWKFIPNSRSDGDFGTLSVDFDENRTEIIGGQEINWRRAFSQVDCQHRLGCLAESDRSVTFCVIPGITRLEEARIFKTINDTQKKISTSLVDAILMLLSNRKTELPDIHLAYDLGSDIDSKFYTRVDAEGRNLAGRDYVVTLRTLRGCISLLIGGKKYMEANITTEDEYDNIYVFLRNFWNAIYSLWPKEFTDAEKYKLMMVPGLKGLSRFGRGIFRKAMEDGDTSKKRILRFFSRGPDLINWGVRGPFRDATGNAGARVVYERLIRRYGDPMK